jgi:catechol 2,3-dioxygenase-like lactoylglutathione lyase family enzyme
MKKYCLIFSLFGLLYASDSFAQFKSGQPFLKVNHITVSVNNLDSMKHWYTNMLFARVARERHSDSLQYVRIGIGDFYIDMLQILGSRREPYQDLPVMQHMKVQGFRHLVFEPDNLEKAYSDLKAKRIAFSNDQDISNKTITHSIFFKDPEGNVLELHTDPAQ